MKIVKARKVPVDAEMDTHPNLMRARMLTVVLFAVLFLVGLIGLALYAYISGLAS